MHTRVTLQCSYSRRLKHIDVIRWDIRRCLKSKYKHEMKNNWPTDDFLKDGKALDLEVLRGRLIHKTSFDFNELMYLISKG